MVMSVTLSFMLYAFVRQSERFSKNDRLIWLIFYLKRDFVRVYMCLSLRTFR